MINIEWYHSEGTMQEAPLPVNLDWSPNAVYLHKNVQRIEKTDEQGQKYEVWDYDEAILTRADYAIYLAEQATANVEYVAMMTDVDLDDDEEE